MREGLKALLLPHKAPVITHLNHMGDPTILPHKAALLENTKIGGVEKWG